MIRRKSKEGIVAEKGFGNVLEGGFEEEKRLNQVMNLQSHPNTQLNVLVRITRGCEAGLVVLSRKSCD